MNNTKIIREFAKIKEIESSIITIGKFNGVHIGHQELIKYVVAKAAAENKASIVMIINVHKKSIYNFDYNLDILKKLGVNYIVVVDFSTEFYKISSTDFFYKISDYYNISEIVIGEDFAFGHNREGHVADLISLCENANIGINVFPFCFYNNEKVSSSKIIEHIEAGRIELVGAMLGRTYSYSSTVEVGKRLGRTIGFPTANLKPTEGLALPKDGVYFSKTSIEDDDSWKMSMTFVGSTSLVDELKFETHIFDYNDEIYGKKIEVRLYYYHRENIKVNSIEELKTTLENDKINTYRYFN